MTTSKPWYEAAFNEDYLERYAHRDREEARRIVRLFTQRTSLPEDAIVMDLCCGAGRHAAALRLEGYQVAGLDLSSDLLGAARRFFREEVGCGCDEADPDNCPYFVRADKRYHPFRDGRFDAVTHFFTAFGYFDDDEENFAVFDQVRRVLKPDGYYLFDFLSEPMIRREFADCDSVEAEEDFDDGTYVATRKRLSPDQRRIEKDVTFYHHGKKVRHFTESVRLFSPEELRTALKARGLEICEEWGAYDGTAYRADKSGRWIALSRKVE